MNSRRPSLLPGHDVDAAPGALPADPLQFLFAENWRQRQVCSALAHIAAMPMAEPELLLRLAGFLREDMALHIEDKERDLFRLLRKRAEPDDDLHASLARLTADHGQIATLARQLCDGLEAAANAGIAPSAQPGLSDIIETFVARKRQHVALENAVILPIARLRLQHGDLAELAEALSARPEVLSARPG